MSDSDSDSHDIILSNNKDMVIQAKTSQNKINLQTSSMSIPRTFQSSLINMSRNLQNRVNNLPGHFERANYAESCYDQRSIYSGREMSPASLRSCPNLHPRTLHQTYHGGGLSQRSMFNGRSGSSMSVHSFGSNASIASAADIVSALKNIKFNKSEMVMLKDAFKKLVKNDIRTKISKRRNRRLLRAIRRNSGYDSGEQGSDSSLSSEGSVISNGGRSVRTDITAYKSFNDNNRLNRENLPSSRSTSSCKLSRLDLHEFKKSMQNSNCYKDCSDSFQQKALQNIVPVGYINVNNPTQKTSANFNTPTLQERFTSNFKLPSQRFGNYSNRSILPINKENSKMQVDNTDSMSSKMLANSNTPTLQERFTSNFKLPSQRFANYSNKSILPMSKENDKMQLDNTDSMSTNVKNKNVFNQKESSHNSNKTVSEDEEIFSKINTRSRSSLNVERNKEEVTQIYSSPPKKKHLSMKVPTKNQINGITFRENTSDGEFEFIKPQLPMKSLANCKIKQKLISKSSQPLKNNVIQSNQNVSQNCKTAQLPKQTNKSHKHNDSPQQEEGFQNIQNLSSIRNKMLKLTRKQQTNQEKKKNENNQQSPLQNSINNQQSPLQNSIHSVSTKPSFTKRKLFTQTLDVTENKSANCDILQTNSPQNGIYSTLKEKNKTRKLATSQSCLNRDVLQDDDNLLDLIHKIVPPDRMSVTNITNKTASNNNDDDKWNESLLTSICNDNDGSDTYTDEDIFNITYGVVNQKENIKRARTKQKDVKTSNVKLNNKAKVKVDKIDITKIHNVKEPIVHVEKLTVSNVKNGISKVNDMYRRAELFWCSDIESDMETRVTTKKPEVQEKRMAKNGTFCNENDLSKPSQITLVQFNRRLPSKRIAARSNKDTSSSKTTPTYDKNMKTDTKRIVLRNRIVKSKT